MYTLAKMCLCCLNNDSSLINYKDCDLNYISAYEKWKQIMPEVTPEAINKLPPWICPPCKEELNNTYIFHKKCQKSLYLLYSYIKKLQSVNTKSNHDDLFTLNVEISPITSPLGEIQETSDVVKNELFQEDTFLFDQIIGRRSLLENNNQFIKEEITETIKTVSDTFQSVKEETCETIKGETSETVKEEFSLFEEDTQLCENNSFEKSVSVVKNEINQEVFKETIEKSYFDMFRNKSALESTLQIESALSAATSDDVLNFSNTNSDNNRKNVPFEFNKRCATLNEEIIEDLRHRSKRRSRPVYFNEESEDDFQNDSDYEPSININLEDLLSDEHSNLSDNRVSEQSAAKKVKTNHLSNELSARPPQTNTNIDKSFENRLNKFYETTRNSELRTPAPKIVIHHLPQTNTENTSTSAIQSNVLPQTENTSNEATTTNSDKNVNKPTKKVNSFRRKFVCNICRSKFKSSEELRAHVASHEIKEFKCKTCFKLCLNEKDLELHTKEHNNVPRGDPPPYPYPYPFQNPYTTSILEATLQTPTTIKISQVNPTPTINSSAINYHHLIPEPIEINSDSNAPDDDYYLEKFFCNKCNKKCANFSEHMVIHQNENKAICVYCDTTFPIKNQLFQHLRDVHCANDPKCQICNETFENIELLFLHMYSHYGTEVHKCPKCEQLFLNATQMYRHLETVHNCTEFACIKCDKTFETASLMSLHYVHHESKFSTLCYICGKGFSTKRRMILHIRNLHGSSEDYACQECGKQCSSSQGLKLHKESKHDNLLLNCEFCGKCMKTRQALWVHRASHLQEKKRFDCKECGKKFQHKFLLRNHERIHTGEKPFECKTCGKKFTQEVSLVVHNRIHTGEKPYVCADCGKSYTQSYVYKMHVKKHHFDSKENKNIKTDEEK